MNNLLDDLEKKEKELDDLLSGKYIWKPTAMRCFCCVAPVSAIDSGISHAVQQSAKLSMTKVLENHRTETVISVDKEPHKGIVQICGERIVFSARKFAISLLKNQTCLR